MSYQKKIDEMVGKHIAEFQLEFSLSRQLVEQVTDISLPYGYPVGVYHPMHVRKRPHCKRFIACNGGTLSNGVPKILGTRLIDQYILGVYNPIHA